MFDEDANMARSGWPQERNGPDDAVAASLPIPTNYLSFVANCLGYLLYAANEDWGFLEDVVVKSVRIPYSFIPEVYANFHQFPPLLNGQNTTTIIAIPHTMSSTSALNARLKELSAALGHIHPLVSRLHNFTVAVGQGDEARLELGAEIHGLLKEAEEQLELLKVDVEALESGSDSRRKTVDNEKELERERIVASAGRLTDDLKK